MKKIRIYNIACAAWMKWNDIEFLGMENNNEFLFLSDKKATDWLNEYQKTDFKAVDTELLALRDLVRQNKSNSK